MKKIRGKKKKKAENNWNIPNALTVLRIILAAVVVYMIFTGEKIIFVVAIFAIAALTDLFDGRLARRWKQTTELGRKMDMIADRFLWSGTAIAFVIYSGFKGLLLPIHGIQLLMLMSREIISMPFALTAFFTGKPIPQARYIAKVTTFIQGFALPALMLSIYYPAWAYLSIPLSIVIAATGTISAMYYIKDIKKK